MPCVFIQFVLHRIGGQDFDVLVEKAVDALKLLLGQGAQEAMNQYNNRDLLT